MHSISDTVLITSDEIPRDLLRDRKIIRFRVIIRFGLTSVLIIATSKLKKKYIVTSVKGLINSYLSNSIVQTSMKHGFSTIETNDHFTSKPKCMSGSSDPGITIVNPTEISVMYGYVT